MYHFQETEGLQIYVNVVLVICEKLEYVFTDRRRIEKEILPELENIFDRYDSIGCFIYIGKNRSSFQIPSDI